MMTFSSVTASNLKIAKSLSCLQSHKIQKRDESCIFLCIQLCDLMDFRDVWWLLCSWWCADINLLQFKPPPQCLIWRRMRCSQDLESYWWLLIRGIKNLSECDIPQMSQTVHWKVIRKLSISPDLLGSVQLNFSSVYSGTLCSGVMWIWSPVCDCTVNSRV